MLGDDQEIRTKSEQWMDDYFLRYYKETDHYEVHRNEDPVIKDNFCGSKFLLPFVNVSTGSM